MDVSERARDAIRLVAYEPYPLGLCHLHSLV
jgi:hypothetical protein